MWINFTRTIYGTSYGGGLEEPFQYMGRIISDRFQNKKIEFPYQEIEINLGFLSSHKNEKALEWYNKLPIYYRGKNMVRITLPMIKKEKSLADVFLLIHKAFDIITAKKKKDDVFDADKIKETLLQLEKELQITDMWELSNKYKNLLRQETIDRIIKERNIREQTNDEKKRLIYDLRFMYNFENIEKLYFSPYSEQFCNRILNKLRERKFKLPNYTHLYIQVSDSFENALCHAIRIENWFVYGIAVLKNYTDYALVKEVEKKRIVFDLLKQGLHDIAKIDKLDSQTLNEVLDEVEQDIFKKYKYLDKEN